MARTIERLAAAYKLPLKCAYCGATENLSRDHIIPRSKGGTLTRKNVQILCVPCNIKKGDSGIAAQFRCTHGISIGWCPNDPLR